MGGVSTAHFSAVKLGTIRLSRAQIALLNKATSKQTNKRTNYIISPKAAPNIYIYLDLLAVLQHSPTSL